MSLKILHLSGLGDCSSFSHLSFLDCHVLLIFDLADVKGYDCTSGGLVVHWCCTSVYFVLIKLSPYKRKENIKNIWIQYLVIHFHEHNFSVEEVQETRLQLIFLYAMLCVRRLTFSPNCVEKEDTHIWGLTDRHLSVKDRS